MYRKPFRPPLLKRPPEHEVEVIPSSPPLKKQRLSGQSDQDQEASQSSRESLCILETNSVHQNVASSETSPQGRFAVLWRARTNKKHKTWDGDGTLLLSGGFAYLHDDSGRAMGKVRFDSPLLPGSTLVVAGKEVEVDALLSKEEYRDRKGSSQAVEKAKVPSPVQMKKVVSRPRPLLKEIKAETFYRTVDSSTVPTGMDNAFKSPMLSKAPAVKHDASGVIPRHDPHEQNALVMRRPETVPRGKRVVDVVVDPVLTKRLRDHQREGVKFMYECVMGLRDFDGQGAILADEMGLGKTLQTIALIWTLLKQSPIYQEPPVLKKILIVCPVTLINNWRKEFRKWLGREKIGVFVADGQNPRIRDFTVGKSYSVMIIGYEKLRSVQEELQRGADIDLVVADEGHRLKTAQNKSAKAIRSLDIPRRIVLSGTPVQNDLSEFFEMVDLVNPGLLQSYSKFRSKYEAPILRGRQPDATQQEIERGEEQSQDLAALTQPFILRRTMDVLDKYLPPKTEYVLFCRPTSSQADVYQKVLSSPLFDRILKSTEAALHMITLLKKVCNSPALLAGQADKEKVPDEGIAALLDSMGSRLSQASPISSSTKMRVLERLLRHLRSATSEKVVLVSNYTSTLDVLQGLLTARGYQYLRLDGSTPASKRQDLVDTFNRTLASMCFAFLLSAKAGGTGINLIGASRLVLFDVDWNPSTELQAMARIHRDGQKRPVHIYRLLVAGALDEKVWQRQLTKMALADSVVDQKVNPSSFSMEDLRDLFSLDTTSTCQTHDLLGCDCCGSGGGREEGQPRREVIQVEDSDGEGSSDEEAQLPAIPTLIKASDLHRSVGSGTARDSEAKRGRKAKESGGTEAKKMSSLMQYAHLDTTAFGRKASGDEGVVAEEKKRRVVEVLGRYEAVGGEEEGDNSEGKGKGKQGREGDGSSDGKAILHSVLSEEGNRVQFVFVKSTGVRTGPGGVR